MKTKTIAFLFTLIVVISANIFFAYDKNDFLQQEIKLINILALADDESDFPEDPWKDEDSGELKYKRRVVMNYYEYTYTYLYSDLYREYQTPVTEVDCIGNGDVSCIRSLNLGVSKDNGIVKESDKKQ